MKHIKYETCFYCVVVIIAKAYVTILLCLYSTSTISSFTAINPYTIYRPC